MRHGGSALLAQSDDATLVVDGTLEYCGRVRREKELRSGKQRDQLANGRTLSAGMEMEVHLIDGHQCSAFEGIVEKWEKEDVAQDQIEEDHEDRLVAV